MAGNNKTITSKQRAKLEAAKQRELLAAKRFKTSTLEVGKLEKELEKAEFREQWGGRNKPTKKAAPKKQQARVAINRAPEVEHGDLKYDTIYDSPPERFQAVLKPRETAYEKLAAETEDLVLVKRVPGMRGAPGAPGRASAPGHGTATLRHRAPKDLVSACSIVCSAGKYEGKLEAMLDFTKMYFSAFIRARSDLFKTHKISRRNRGQWDITSSDVTEAAEHCGLLCLRQGYADHTAVVSKEVMSLFDPSSPATLPWRNARDLHHRMMMYRVRPDPKPAALAAVGSLIQNREAHHNDMPDDRDVVQNVVTRVMKEAVESEMPLCGDEFDRVVEREWHKAQRQRLAIINLTMRIMAGDEQAAMTEQRDTLVHMAKVNWLIRCMQQGRIRVWQLMETGSILKKIGLPGRRMYELTFSQVADRETTIEDFRTLSSFGKTAERPVDLKQADLQPIPLGTVVYVVTKAEDWPDDLEKDLTDVTTKANAMFDRIRADIKTTQQTANMVTTAMATMAQVGSANGEITAKDDVKYTPDDYEMPNKKPKVGEPWWDPSVPGYLVCNRNQLTDLYKSNTMASGLYYVDTEFVFSLAQAPPDIVIPPMTDLLLSNLEAEPWYETYFIIGRVVGGKGKKKAAAMTKAEAANIIKKGLKRIRGKGAYGAPAVNYAGKGAFLPKSVTSGLKNMLKQGAKAALKQGAKELARGAMTGMGSYQSAMSTFPADSATVTNHLVNNVKPYYKFVPSDNESEGGTLHFWEYVGDVFCDTTNVLNVVSIPFQPALPLGPMRRSCQTACNYETYEVDQLIFHFQSNVFSTEGSIGEVGMLFDHNAGDPTVWDSRFAIMEYGGSVMVKTNQNAICGVECDPKKHLKATRYYTRTNGITNGQDIKTYDFGILNLITYNIPAAVVPDDGLVGRVYVQGTIRLGNPKVCSALGWLALIDQFTSTAGCSQSNYSGSNQYVATTNNAGGSFTTRTYTFSNSANGTFRITLQLAGTTFAGVQGTPVLAGNVTYSNYEINGQSVVFVANSTSAVLIATVRVAPALTNGGNTITFTVGGFTAATVTSTLMQATMINPAARS